jgi:hypothetical protein
MQRLFGVDYYERMVNSSEKIDESIRIVGEDGCLLECWDV